MAAKHRTGVVPHYLCGAQPPHLHDRLAGVRMNAKRIATAFIVATVFGTPLTIGVQQSLGNATHGITSTSCQPRDICYTCATRDRCAPVTLLGLPAKVHRVARYTLLFTWGQQLAAQFKVTCPLARHRAVLDAYSTAKYQHVDIFACHRIYHLKF